MVGLLSHSLDGPVLHYPRKPRKNQVYEVDGHSHLHIDTPGWLGLSNFDISETIDQGPISAMSKSWHCPWFLSPRRPGICQVTCAVTYVRA